MNIFRIVIPTIFAGVVAAMYLVWRLNQFRKTEAYKLGDKWYIRLLKREESFIMNNKNNLNTLLKKKRSRNWQVGRMIEILIIGLWVLWVGREYLNFDSQFWPIGREFGIQYISHNFWNLAKECGACALWNGSLNGGAPALADPFTSTFHPLVMISTLLLGIVNGIKAATLVTLWIAGITQWGIASLLGARRIIRIWSGGLVVVGGHLLGKLELGAFGITLSITMATLVLLAVMYFVKENNKRSVLYLAAAFSLLLLAGHGYMQLAVLCWLPIISLLVISKKPRLTKRKFGLALLLGTLLSALLIIPVIHFFPNFQKFSDLNASLNQDIAFIPLNLVINNWNYYLTDALAKPPFPYLTNNFIGWIPVILAILTLAVYKKNAKTHILIFSSSILVYLFLASGLPIHWAAKLVPGISGIRNTQLIAGLMVPPLIGLASYSTEQLFGANWPQLDLSIPSGNKIGSLSIRWLLLIPLGFSIYQGYQFNQSFLSLDNARIYFQTVEKVPNKITQWFAPPFGEHWWVLPSVEHDLKLTEVVTPWWWKEREKPAPYYQMTSAKSEDNPIYINHINDQFIFQNSDNAYAYIITGSQVFPCQAQANGGLIKVTCNSRLAGQLIVKEYNYSGWYGSVDKRRTRVYGESWITVETPAGLHSFTFRYLPLDVLLGLVLSCSGLAIFLWICFMTNRQFEEILEKYWRRNPPE